jgi:hypothetical protein
MKGEKPRSSPEGTATDAEIAWRLHQELNAISPMLRTRARKAATSTKASDAENAKEEPTTDDENPTPAEPSAAPAESPTKKAAAEQPLSKKVKNTTADDQIKRENRTRAEKPLPAAEKRKPPQDEDGATTAPPSKKKDKKQPPVEETSVPNPVAVPSKHRSRKGRPEPAAEAGEQRVASSSKPKPPTKPPKIPKLPMVRQGKRWYRARLMKETGEKALIGK